MTTLTQSDLNDLRRKAEAAALGDDVGHFAETAAYLISVPPKRILALLDHIAKLAAKVDSLEASRLNARAAYNARIAQLTAERDEAQTTVERERRQEEALRCDFEEELKSARARIAALKAQLAERDAKVKEPQK